MPLATFPILLTLAVLATLGSMIYLLINARSAAELFRKTELVPGPGRARTSRRAVITALVVFNLGWLCSIGIRWLTWSNTANQAVHSEAYDG